MAAQLPIGFAGAETLDFGGVNDKYKGSGDKTPPQCQVSYPSASTEAFFVKWNCTDDIADSLDIKTDFWFYPKGAPVGQLLTSFLGFPAAVKIDEHLLKVTNFTDGLPISFRLAVTDRAGNTTMTPLLRVGATDNSIAKCELTAVSAASESNGSTTGVPESQVLLNDTSVNVTPSASGGYQIEAKKKNYAKVCDIDTLCADTNQVSFSTTLSAPAGSASQLTGELTLAPGDVVLKVEGSGTVVDQSLENVDVSGTTQIDGRSTKVTLTCSK